jgi:hypothetical protein
MRRRVCGSGSGQARGVPGPTAVASGPSLCAASAACPSGRGTRIPTAPITPAASAPSGPAVDRPTPPHNKTAHAWTQLSYPNLATLPLPPRPNQARSLRSLTGRSLRSRGCYRPAHRLLTPGTWRAIARGSATLRPAYASLRHPPPHSGLRAPLSTAHKPGMWAYLTRKLPANKYAACLTPLPCP